MNMLIFILSVLCITGNSLHRYNKPRTIKQINHFYYSIQKSRFFPQSKSSAEVTKCKNECLLMNNHFPHFTFMFHRLILRKGTSEFRYVQGTCHYKKIIDTIQVKYSPWSKFPLKNQQWSSYNLLCQNPQLKMDLNIIKSMGFNQTHSNFQYYDSGKFVNNEPFDDLSMLMNRVLKRGNQLKRKLRK